MTKPLVFMMGRSPAFIPTDRKYARNHMWVQPNDGAWRLGLSAYAVRLLGEVHLLSWSVEPGETIEHRQQIGYVEAAKATSDLYAPVSGSVAQTNPDVVTNPKLINSNLYDGGWLMSVVADHPTLLSPEEYVSHLETCWPLAQRLLKDQAGKGDHEE